MTDAPEPAVSAPAATEVERRIVSALFADLVGFTPLAERLDAEDVATIQDAYFSTTRDTIARYGGVVEKFIGDAVMAVFGVPRGRDDDAERAVRAGLALIGAVEQLNARLGLEPGSLQLRVGVNTGEVVHAVAGPDAGRVTGDTINTAARLQAAARPGSVLLGELTALAVADAIASVAVGGIELKGKAEAVRACEAVGVRPHPSREEALGSLHAPTLGREAELTRLEAAVAAVADERRAGRLVVVAPPGVGKTRLLGDLSARLRGPVRRARVRPQATAPYETVAQLFGGASAAEIERVLIATGTAPARASVVVAEVGRLREPDASRSAAGDLAAERESRFAAWLEALDALDDDARTAARKGDGPTPPVWLVEDVHWAGGDLLAFLADAGSAPTRRGRLVIATARPSLLETAPDWCETDRLDLAPLAGAAAADLVRALVGDALPEALVGAVVERSDGTPLFIEELIRTWVSVGTLARDEAAGGWALTVEPESVVLPATVQAIYAAQLDDLPGDARLVARRGSVAGRRVPDGALGALELSDRRAGVEMLRRRAFLADPVRDDVTGDAYPYRHALLRDAAYASLARVERARLHVAMAHWLQEAAGPRVDIVSEAIAEQYAEALDSLPALAGPDLPDRRQLATAAAAWSERAAAAALGLSAHQAARRLLERSIALTDATAQPDLARRRLAYGRVLAESANLDAGITEIEASRDLYAASLPESAAGYATAAYSLGRAYMQQIRFPEAAEVTRMALDALDAAGADEPAGRSRLMALHAWAISALGRTDGVLEEARAAEELAASVADPSLELDILEHASATRSEVGETDPSVWRRMAQLAAEQGRWHQAVVAARNGALADADGHPAAALPGMDAAAELAAAHGLTEQLGWCELGRCETRFVLGDWDAALDAGGRAIDLAERYAYVRLGFRAWMVVLPMLAARRDATWIPRYDAWWPEAQRHFPPTPSPYGQFLLGAVDVWRAEATGAAMPTPDPALGALEVQFSNPHFVAAIEAVIGAWLVTGRVDLARTVASWPLDDEATPLMRSSAALRHAMVAVADGDPSAAAQQARDAAIPAREIGAAWWLARALVLLGDSEGRTLADRLRLPA